MHDMRMRVHVKPHQCLHATNGAAKRTFCGVCNRTKDHGKTRNGEQRGVLTDTSSVNDDV